MTTYQIRHRKTYKLYITLTITIYYYNTITNKKQNDNNKTITTRRKNKEMEERFNTLELKKKSEQKSKPL